MLDGQARSKQQHKVLLALNASLRSDAQVVAGRRPVSICRTTLVTGVGDLSILRLLRLNGPYANNDTAF